MSYSVYFTIHPTTAPDVELDLPNIDLNITSNLRQLFQALPIGNLNQLNQQLASNVEASIQESIHQLREHPERYKTYESPNGWGTLLGAMNFLEDFYKACQKYPYAILRVD